MKCFPIICLLFISCGSTPSHYKVIHADTVSFAKFPYIRIETDIQKLVDKLDKSECVIAGGFGWGGQENETFDSYKRLLEIAHDSTWFRLSYSKNPVLQIYAFMAMHHNKSPHLEEVRARLRKDKTTVCVISEDTKSIYSVDDSVFILK